MKATATVFHDMSGVGGQTFGGQGGTWQGGQTFRGHGGTVPAGQTGGNAANPGGRVSLYDEKFVLSGKGVFNAKAPQTWLQDMRDYLAGRSVDLDNVIDWAERQTIEIPMVPNHGAGDFPMFDQCLVGLRRFLDSPGPSSARS